MELTPTQVASASFRTVRKGYDPDEVDAFLRRQARHHADQRRVVRRQAEACFHRTLVDEARIDGADGFVTQAELVHYAGAEVLL